MSTYQDDTIPPNTTIKPQPTGIDNTPQEKAKRVPPTKHPARLPRQRDNAANPYPQPHGQDTE